VEDRRVTEYGVADAQMTAGPGESDEGDVSTVDERGDGSRVLMAVSGSVMNLSK
jgi:hypothetical protein